MLGLLKVAVIMGQLVYWLILKDDGRDEVVWDACVHPGRRA